MYLLFVDHLLQEIDTCLVVVLNQYLVQYLTPRQWMNLTLYCPAVRSVPRRHLVQMLCFLKEITKWIDEGSPVNSIYLDFQKAFDKVPHQRLLLKLKAHGIGDSIIDWIEKWLTDRRQRVVVDREASNWK